MQTGGVRRNPSRAGPEFALRRCTRRAARKVAALQARLNALGKEAAKPLALIYVTGVGLKHGKPLMGSVDGKGPVLIESSGHAITDEGFGEREVHP